jgi:hypothetical protein
MSRILGRFHKHEQHQADLHKIARILIDVGEPAPEIPAGHATAGGDERKLRGIPAIGRGVAGAVPGTAPHTLDIK